MKYYLFKANEVMGELKNLEAKIGKSLFTGAAALIGIPFEITERNNRLVFLRDGVTIGHSEELYDWRVWYGRPEQSPIKVKTEYGDCAPSKLMIFNTCKGETYALMPEIATPEFI